MYENKYEQKNEKKIICKKIKKNKENKGNKTQSLTV